MAIVVGEKWRDNILEINRISDRLITEKLLIDTININIVSAYIPQVGCTDEEKEEFWEELEELIRSFSEKDKIVLGADLNGHIGRVPLDMKDGMVVLDMGKRTRKGTIY